MQLTNRWTDQSVRKETNMNAVIFDMDGVLLDSEQLWIDCWEKLGEQYGLKGISPCLHASIGTTAEKTREIFMEAFGNDFPYDRYVSEASTLFHQAELEGKLLLKPGSKEILVFLHENGVKTALATSTEMNTAKRQMKERGLYEYFDQMVFGSQIKRSKPAPDIFLKAAEMLEVSPAECFVIEDSFNGVRAAHAAGMHPVMVPDLLQPTDEIRKLCEAVCVNLDEACQWLAEKLIDRH